MPPKSTDAEADPDVCGHPTKRGSLCRNHPMHGADRCYHHAGLPRTEAEIAASRANPIKHGYFVTGFLDEEERELFDRVLDGELETGAIKRQVIAALIVRAARITRWEAEGEQVSGFATEVFTELRKALESVSPDELRVEHSWSDAEVADQVKRVLSADPDLLIRLLPPSSREAVQSALQENPT